ncbi:TOM13-domain-containing protein [Ascodesmis nigricans]|uniref:TOM13-domain-containing protein n=1 Tax=Ascodesmis nigricans TaxID=341454 RepID=A0A4S2N7P7_9PEZI|nr:TOM13-domain-containing protein [Ascodesmis nigricans]
MSHHHDHDHFHGPHCNHDDENSDEDRPMLLYKPPTALSLLRTTAINLILPFINGLMLGFGELFAHELAFRWGWGTTRVCSPSLSYQLSIINSQSLGYEL